jgi:hypothetical protein
LAASGLSFQVIGPVRSFGGVFYCLISAADALGIVPQGPDQARLLIGSSSRRIMVIRDYHTAT